MKQKIWLGGTFVFECYDRRGRLRWRDVADNLVVYEGLRLALDNLFALAPEKAGWYVGLLSATPVVILDNTMAVHPGWTEVTAYNEATRPAFTAVRIDQMVSNTASRAIFTISAPSTVGGAMLTSSNVKGNGAGTLLCAAAFAEGNKALGIGDILLARYDFSAANPA